MICSPLGKLANTIAFVYQVSEEAEAANIALQDRIDEVQSMIEDEVHQMDNFVEAKVQQVGMCPECFEVLLMVSNVLVLCNIDIVFLYRDQQMQDAPSARFCTLLSL